MSIKVQKKVLFFKHLILIKQATSGAEDLPMSLGNKWVFWFVSLPDVAFFMIQIPKFSIPPHSHDDDIQNVLTNMNALPSERHQKHRATKGWESSGRKGQSCQFVLSSVPTYNADQLQAPSLLILFFFFSLSIPSSALFKKALLTSKSTHFTTVKFCVSSLHHTYTHTVLDQS